MSQTAEQSARAPVTVTFAKSGKTVQWTPESGTLLDLAEDEGLNPLSSCREGTCAVCRTRLLDGGVAYTEPPSPAAEFAEDEVLICCAVPAESAENSAGVILDL